MNVILMEMFDSKEIVILNNIKSPICIFIWKLVKRGLFNDASDIISPE